MCHQNYCLKFGSKWQTPSFRNLKEVGCKRKRKLKGSYDWTAYTAIESYMGYGYDCLWKGQGGLELSELAQESKWLSHPFNL